MRNTKLFDLTEKTIVVTGGSGYLGASIAEGLASFGANVVIASRNVKANKSLAGKLNTVYKTTCTGGYVDVSDPASIHDFFKSLDTLDVLVNNAYFGAAGRVEEFSEADWQKGMDGAINNVFRCTKEALRLMLPEKKGTIINMASMYGVVAPNPDVYETNTFANPANYGAGKAAVIQFTKYIAATYGREGVRANAVSPGPFPNETVQKDRDFIKALGQKTPLGRIGKPEELQGILVYLASDASSYVTGQNICVDGGWTAW